MASASENAPQARCRFADVGLNQESFEVLYADGLRRDKATKSKETKPLLSISPEIQNYIKHVNLDPENGDTLWKQLKRHWPGAPPRAEQVCRLVVRALRNKRSANAAQLNGNRARAEDKATIKRLAQELADTRTQIQENEVWSSLLVHAANANLPRKTGGQREFSREALSKSPVGRGGTANCTNVIRMQFTKRRYSAIGWVVLDKDL